MGQDDPAGAPPSPSEPEHAGVVAGLAEGVDGHGLAGAAADHDSRQSTGRSSPPRAAGPSPQHLRDAIRQAHEEAKNAALALIEDRAALTRTGADGVAQIRARPSGAGAGSRAWRSAFIAVPRGLGLGAVLADGVSGSKDGQEVLVEVVGRYGSEPA